MNHPSFLISRPAITRAFLLPMMTPPHRHCGAGRRGSENFAQPLSRLSRGVRPAVCKRTALTGQAWNFAGQAYRIGVRISSMIPLTAATRSLICCCEWSLVRQMRIPASPRATVGKKMAEV